VIGSIEEAIPAQERAIRLSPRDPQIWLYYFWIGQVHLIGVNSEKQRVTKRVAVQASGAEPLST
jgi:hypothetical protein